MEKNIALLRGDGIGPEIVDSAVAVLEVVAEKFGHTFNFTPYLIGGAAIDATGNPLPQETVDGCLAADSVLLGAVGGPKWDTLPANVRPEKGLLGIRSLWDFTLTFALPDCIRRWRPKALCGPTLPPRVLISSCSAS